MNPFPIYIGFSFTLLMLSDEFFPALPFIVFNVLHITFILSLFFLIVILFFTNLDIAVSLFLYVMFKYITYWYSENDISSNEPL